MSTLLLKLAGPLQSWGDSSRFVYRKTRHEPTKSGVIGLLAAAQGRRRSDPIEDLLQLQFGVRIDQPGRIERDFQSAINPQRGARGAMPLSYRYYLSDATFVVGLEAESSLLHSLADALNHPAFPLYLGRRSCVPSGKLVLGIREDCGLVEALNREDWQASRWYRKRQPREIRLQVIRDELVDEKDTGRRELVSDLPLSFAETRRSYGWRTVVPDGFVNVTNPDGYQTLPGDHDPFAALKGAS